MANKRITELPLRDDMEDDVNFPGDDGTQTYRVTGTLIKAWNEEYWTKNSMDTGATKDITDGYTLIRGNLVIPTAKTWTVETGGALMVFNSIQVLGTSVLVAEGTGVIRVI